MPLKRSLKNQTTMPDQMAVRTAKIANEIEMLALAPNKYVQNEYMHVPSSQYTTIGTIFTIPSTTY